VTMQTVRLSEVKTELESGGRPKGGASDLSSGVLSVGGEHVSIDGSFLLQTKRFVPNDFFESMRRGRLQRDDILIVKDGATTGKVAFVDSTLPLPAAVNEHVFRLAVDSEKVLPRYVFYHLLSPRGNRQILQDFRGATVGGISQDFPEKVEFPLPSLCEQQRLVGQLERVDRLRHTGCYALGLNDAFLPAAFLQLFGNPVLNTKDWPVSELEEIATVERGKFTPRPRNDPTYYGGIFPFIQTGDISDSGGRLRSWTQTLNEKGTKVSRSFPPGTIVIAIVGATIGVTAILEVEVFCPDSVVGIQVNPTQATKEYIEFLLRFWRPIFIAQAPETARANINLDSLRPLRVQVPPLSLQQTW
jgi:restriction endonuclease S subunit